VAATPSIPIDVPVRERYGVADINIPHARYVMTPRGDKNHPLAAEGAAGAAGRAAVVVIVMLALAIGGCATATSPPGTPRVERLVRIQAL
jgi:hypothetical protein